MVTAEEARQALLAQIPEVQEQQRRFEEVFGKEVSERIEEEARAFRARPKGPSPSTIARLKAEAESRRITEERIKFEEEQERLRLEAEQRARTQARQEEREKQIEFQSRELEFERVQAEFIKLRPDIQERTFIIKGQEFTGLELIKLGIEAGIRKFPGETEAQFRSRAISMGRGVASTFPTEAQTIITGGVTISKETLDKLKSERKRILKDIAITGREQADATTTQEKIAKGKELQNLRIELRKINQKLGGVGGFVEITQPEVPPPTKFEEFVEKAKEKLKPVTERFKKAQETVRKQTERFIFMPLERRGITPTTLAEVTPIIAPVGIGTTPSLLFPAFPPITPSPPALKEFQIGFVEGQLVDIREKPLKQAALFGAGYAGGIAIKGIGVGIKIISPTSTKIVGGTGKLIGAGILGFIAFKTGEELVSAASPREAGKIVGVTFKDVLIVSAGVKAGTKIIKTRPSTEVIKAREKALESERLKRLGLGKKAKIETVGAVEEAQIRRDIIRSVDDENLIKLMRKGTIGKVNRFNVKTKKLDERIILRNVERIDGAGRELTMTFRLTKEGRLLKPRVLITDLKSGESLLLRPATPRELRTFEVKGIKVQEVERLKIEKVLLGKGNVKIAEVKIDDKTIRLLEKKGIVFQIGGKGRGTISTADLQRLGKTPLIIRKVEPIPVAKLSSLELQLLKKGRGITLEAGVTEQIPKPLDIKITKVSRVKIEDIPIGKKPTGKGVAGKIFDVLKLQKFLKIETIEQPRVDIKKLLTTSGLKSLPARTPEALGFGEQIIIIPGLPRQPLSQIILPTTITEGLIKLPTTLEIDKAITKLKQRQELDLKLREKIELATTIPVALNLLGVSQLTKQQQKLQQKQLQKLTVRPRLIQRQVQPTAQISDVIQALKTPTPPPKPPKIKIPGVSLPEIPKKPIPPAKQPGYWPKAQPINQKKFVKLTKVPVTKQQAEDIGSFLVDNSLSTNWKIEEAKGFAKQPKIDIPENYFENNRHKFRDFRIRKGKKIPTPNSYIERRGLPRLDTFAEINNIQLLRALKNLQVKSSVRRKQVKKLRGKQTRKVLTMRDLQRQQPQKQKQIKEEDIFAPIEFPSVF